MIDENSLYEQIADNGSYTKRNIGVSGYSKRSKLRKCNLEGFAYVVDVFLLEYFVRIIPYEKTGSNTLNSVCLDLFVMMSDSLFFPVLPWKESKIHQSILPYITDSIHHRIKMIDSPFQQDSYRYISDVLVHFCR